MAKRKDKWRRRDVMLRRMFVACITSGGGAFGAPKYDSREI
jgi:hypothetical protein